MEKRMQQTDNDDREITLNNDERMTVGEFITIRKDEGLKIDPATAEVDWNYALVFDPYGVYPMPPEDSECNQVGRAYFARRPGSDVWVEFGDLPKTGTGKIQKFVLREREWAGYDKRVH